MMQRPAWEFPRERAERTVSEIGLGVYRLTLTGLLQPLPFHVVFNALIATGLVMLGHPAAAAATFGTYCAVDVAHHLIVRRWISSAHRISDAQGFRRLAPLCAARMTGYLAPTLFIALNGHRGEIMLFLVQSATLMAVAISASLMTRTVFWGLAMPIVASLGILALATLSPLQAGAVLIAVISLAVLSVLMTDEITRTVEVLLKAYNANVAMIPELKKARDGALAERQAADEAREEARQAGRAKANFLATMSHEIRTPMNGVLGMAQLLQRDETDPAQKQRLAVLIESGEYLLAILNDILDVSKIDAGRLDIVPVAEDMNRFFETLVSFWAPRADEKGVALVLDIKPSTPAFVLIDSLRVRQVLFNLVGNALKFTDKGSVSILADALPAGEGATLLHIAVKDTGSGISPEHLPQLFTRFTQGDQPEAHKYGGSGLGLAIAKQLVELMGGQIWAESELGQGSIFHIKLPLQLADGASLQAGEAAAYETVSQSALRVLAVDDNAVNLMVLDQVLSSQGHNVIKAASGAEALARLDETPVDLVLLDIQMPGLSGFEVLQQLRSSKGPNSHAPVVALTADVTSGGRNHYLDLGFTEHSPKPIQIPDLMAAITRAMAAPISQRQAVHAA